MPLPADSPLPPETPTTTTEIAIADPAPLRGLAEVDTVLLDEAVNFSPEKARIFLADVEHWIGGIQAIVEHARGALDACSSPAATEELRDADEVEE